MNFRKLSFDCHLPHTTPFPTAIGPMASTPNAPAICSLRTIKSDVVAGIPEGVGERLDEEEPGWKISGKYVSHFICPARSTELSLQAVVLLANANRSS